MKIRLENGEIYTNPRQVILAVTEFLADSDEAGMGYRARDVEVLMDDGTCVWYPLYLELNTK